MNIEEIIKSSLENSEMPFDPKAWEAMSARLDQALPVSSAPKSSFKWGWVAAVVVVAGISALFFINDETKATATEKQKTNAVAPIGEKESVIFEGNQAVTASGTNSVQELARYEEKAAEKQTNKNAVDSSLNSIRTTPPIYVYTPPSDGNYSKAFTFIAPKVSDKYCENERISIKNPNDYAITLVTENKNAFVIEANKNLSIELSEAGNYAFAYQKHGKTVQQEAFKVQSRPKADFYANEETLYDNGLPVNALKSTYAANEYTWMNAKGEVISREQEPQIHLFTKGQHDITLKVEGANGCTSQTTKSVRCEVNYNLLAMNGFNPESASIKNRTFIPYALLERNIPFEMEIIDPKTGQTIYSTKNADEPWDGINRITNQMIPEGSTYMWRVTIYKKEIGEPKNVYQGSITRM